MERKLTDLIDKAVSRRTFLAGASATVAGTVLVGCSDSTPAAVAPTPVTAYSDVDYLNFALNLEYLEAEFYLHAATGTGLSATDSGNATSKTVVGASTQVPSLTAIQSQYINEIAQNELDHVRFLRSALKANAVNAPAIDLNASFNMLASAAGIGATFNPFANYSNYLIGAFIFEDVGVTAYHGAAKLLQSKAYLTAAAEILAVEAYHAASIRVQIVASDAAAGSATLVPLANKVSALRGTLGGGNETALSPTSIVAANATTSIAFDRSTDQVLHIVYGTAGNGPGVGSGVFFPNGLNGNIKVTTV